MADQINAVVEPKLDPKYDHYTYPITNPMTGSGHPGHVNAEQDAKLFQLRSELEKEGYTERLDTLTLVCLSLFLCGQIRGEGVADEGMFSFDF
jgi:hypothetical protein